MKFLILGTYGSQISENKHHEQMHHEYPLTQSQTQFWNSFDPYSGTYIETENTPPPYDQLTASILTGIQTTRAKDTDIRFSYETMQTSYVSTMMLACADCDTKLFRHYIEDTEPGDEYDHHGHSTKHPGQNPVMMERKKAEKHVKIIGEKNTAGIRGGFPIMEQVLTNEKKDEIQKTDDDKKVMKQEMKDDKDQVMEEKNDKEDEKVMKQEKNDDKDQVIEEKNDKEDEKEMKQEKNNDKDQVIEEKNDKDNEKEDNVHVDENVISKEEKKNMEKDIHEKNVKTEEEIIKKGIEKDIHSTKKSDSVDIKKDTNIVAVHRRVESKNDDDQNDYDLSTGNIKKRKQEHLQVNEDDDLQLSRHPKVLQKSSSSSSSSGDLQEHHNRNMMITNGRKLNSKHLLEAHEQIELNNKPIRNSGGSTFLLGRAFNEALNNRFSDDSERLYLENLLNENKKLKMQQVETQKKTQKLRSVSENNKHKMLLTENIGPQKKENNLLQIESSEGILDNALKIFGISNPAVDEMMKNTDVEQTNLVVEDGKGVVTDPKLLQSSSQQTQNFITEGFFEVERFKDTSVNLKNWFDARKLILAPTITLYNGQPHTLFSALQDLVSKCPSSTLDQCDENSSNCGVKQGNHLDLKDKLIETFSNPEFLNITISDSPYAYDATATRETKADHIQKVLQKMKDKLKFYQNECIPIDCGKPAITLGRQRCSDSTVANEDNCVYENVMACLCTESSNTDNIWFTYARWHGVVDGLNAAQQRNTIGGQCEEFSRFAFALLSLLGYDTRYIIDFTDHVFLEVCVEHDAVDTDPRNGKPKCNEWMHADPSEADVDHPLLYEKDWGKTLTLNVAITPDYVEEVTERYTEEYEIRVGQREFGNVDCYIYLVNQKLCDQNMGDDYAKRDACLGPEDAPCTYNNSR